MIFNHQDIELKDVYIVSPSMLLNLESDELSCSLKINRANRVSTNQLYSGLIKQYYRENSIPFNTDFNMELNRGLCPDFISRVYSRPFIDSFRENIREVLTPGTEKGKLFFKQEEGFLLEENEKFLNPDEKSDDLLKILSFESKLGADLQKIMELAVKLPFENARYKVRSYNQQIESSANKDKTLIKKKEVLERLLQNWEMSEETKYNKKGEVALDDQIYDEVFDFFGVKSNKNKSGYYIPEYKALKKSFANSLELFDAYRLYYEKVKRLLDFKPGASNEYYPMLIEGVIRNIKKENHIDLQTVYEFELLLHLSGCQLFF